LGRNERKEKTKEERRKSLLHFQIEGVKGEKGEKKEGRSLRQLLGRKSVIQGGEGKQFTSRRGRGKGVNSLQKRGGERTFLWEKEEKLGRAQGKGKGKRMFSNYSQGRKKRERKRRPSFSLRKVSKLEGRRRVFSPTI